MFEFLFWLFLVGIFVASMMDLKRREVDNWLNLFLLISSWGFICFLAVFNSNVDIVIFASLSFAIMFILANIFYYGRVFAGGDAKLLFAMFAVFVGASALATVTNIGIFILFLLIGGSIWGIGFSLFLFFKNFKKAKKEFKKQFDKKYLRYFVLVGIVFFIFSYFAILFLLFAILFFVFPILVGFAKSVEKVVMIKELNGKELREGDWLVRDVKVGGKVVRADWEGLQKEDLELLRKKKKVKIKEGIPFVPGFFIGFLFYWFAKDWVLSLIGGLI